MKQRYPHLLLRPIYGTATVVSLLALVFGSCVDSNYDLDNLDKEVTIGGDNITVPLGTMKNKTLEDLLDGDDFDDLKPDETTGIYTYKHSGEPGIFEIETIPSVFDLESQNRKTVIKYPKFSTPSFGNIDTRKQLPQSSIPSGRVAAGVAVTLGDSGSASCEYSIDKMPSVIKTIDKLYLGDAGSNKAGATLTATLALNGLTAINGGGTMTLTVKAPEFEISADDPSTVNGHTFSQTKQVAVDTNEVTFKLYLHSTDLSNLDLSKTNSLLSKLEYDFRLNLTSKAGTAGSQAPEFSLSADPVCIDADITTAENATIIDPETEHDNVIDMSYTFDGLDGVKSVSKLNFKSGAYVTLSLDENMPEKMEDYLEIKIELPSYYRFKSGNANLDSSTNTLTAKVKAFKGKGQTLELDYIDGSGHPVKDGAIEFDGELVSTVYFPSGQKLKLSDIKSDSDAVAITTNIDVQNKIYIDSVTGKFDYSKEFDSDIDLENIEDFGIDLSTLSLSPIIEFNVTNPTGAALQAEITLTPVDDNGNEITANKVTAKGITIKGNATENIIISTESRREQFAGREFVVADLNKLFDSKETPAMIKIEATVSTTDNECTITLPSDPEQESLIIEYDYAVILPLEFESGSRTTFNYSIDNFSQDLDSVDGIKIKEVVITGKFESTIPLDLVLDVTPIDADGNTLSARDVEIEAVSGYDTIKASTDGTTPQNSEVRIKLELPNGDINDLKKIDKLEIAFTMVNNSNKTVALNKNQELSAIFTLHINGGLTIDLDEM